MGICTDRESNEDIYYFNKSFGKILSYLVYLGGKLLFIMIERGIIMLQVCHEDKEKVYAAIRSGHIDAADLSFPSLIDTIILTMKHQGLLASLGDALSDKR